MSDPVAIATSLSFASIAAAVVSCEAVRRPSVYAGLLTSTFLGGLVINYHAAFAKVGSYDPNPTVAAMSLMTSAGLGAAAVALVGGPSIQFKVSLKNLLTLGGAVLSGTVALTLNPDLLGVTQSYDTVTSCMALLAFGAALVAAYRRQFTMSVLVVVTTAILVVCNALWYGGDPFVQTLTSVTNLVLALLAVGAQPRSDRESGAPAATV